MFDRFAWARWALLAMAGVYPACGWTQSRQALIIGISQYSDVVQAAPLAGVRHDVDSAQKIAAAMGIQANQIVFMRDQQATKSAILAELKRLGESSTDGARALVYFSGHGTRYFDESAGGCIEGLLTYDGQTVTHREFAQATQALSQKADKVMAVMDACHSGGIASSAQRTRSLSSERLAPKFHLRAGGSSDQCAMPSNMRTRGLLGEVTRLGGVQENFVQITSSLPDEVSFDEAGKGGLATQGLRDCLLGQAKDLDASGAVSLDEIRQCAQDFVDRRLKNAIGLLPHHITVRGNRNLIPVAVVQTPPPVVTAPPAIATNETTQPTLPLTAPAAAITPPPPPVQPPVIAMPVASTPASAQTSSQGNQASAPQAPPPPLASPAVAATPPAAAPETASAATLKDIFEQRDPRRKVEVTLDKSRLKIGQDALQLRVKSNRSGHVYVVLRGSDAKSFYLLFPNGLDANHRITAGQTLTLPRPHWQVQASGPAGKDQLLVLVTDTPRSLGQLALTAGDAQNPFTYALNDLQGRSALIQFLVGQNTAGKISPFGAAWVEVEEMP
jgi:hypothetical protein